MDVRIVPLPRIVHEVKPRYPPELLGSGAEGVVELRAMIDASGAVMEVTVVSGPEPFHQAAIEAVRQWRFEPPERVTVVEVVFTFTVR